MEKLRDTNLIFLIKKQNGSISEVCLALKKRGFGMNRWNGVGGKLEAGETIEEAARRETKEEIGAEIGALEKIAELSFYFPHNPSWNQLVHVYFSESWTGEPVESEEMRPNWFQVMDIPFKDMWPDDIYWLPQVLEGNKVRASFTFGEGDVIQNKEINIMEKL